jgi:hypothetical protein
MTGKWDFGTTRQGVSQIKNELTRLFKEQTDFFGKSARAKQVTFEVAAYERRRDRIRGLFAELYELKKAA